MAEAHVTPPPLEVDLDEQEEDSTYGDSLQSYTTSLTSSIKNHTYENGRRYHSYQSGKYFAPNDETESDRLDMVHHMSSLIIGGKLFLAPIDKNPQRILDLGTGTGIWAIEVGDEYPSAEVLGVDLSPTQPSMVPPNVRFEVDDVESDWTYSNPFDLVHARFFAGTISDFPRLVRQAFTHTKPGGYCEFKDWDTHLTSPDNTLSKDSPCLKYHELFFEAADKINVVHTPGPQLRKWVEDAGYVDVTEQVFTVPIGMWPKDNRMKEIGTWNYIVLTEGLEGLCLRLFTKVLGMEIPEIQLLLAQIRAELKDKKVHLQYRYYAVTGRKPETTTSSET